MHQTIVGRVEERNPTNDPILIIAPILTSHHSTLNVERGSINFRHHRKADMDSGSEKAPPGMTQRRACRSGKALNAQAASLFLFIFNHTHPMGHTRRHPSHSLPTIRRWTLNVGRWTFIHFFIKTPISPENKLSHPQHPSHPSCSAPFPSPTRN